MRLVWVIVGGVAIAAAGVAAFAMSAAGFDSARWQAQRGIYDTTNQRGGMLSPLLGDPNVLGDPDELLSPGVPEAEVLALLGEPDARDGAVWVYTLGFPAYSIDMQELRIRFADGVIVDHSILQY